MVRVERENLILIPAFGFLVAATMLLYRDLNIKSIIDTSKLVKIGESVLVTENVKRRFTGDSFWNDLETRDDVFEKDTLQTGSDSRVQIKFSNGGSTLSLSENSLVVLDMSEEKLSVNIVQGSIATKGSKDGKGAITLKSGNRTIQATGSIDLSVAKDGQTQLSVSDGSAKVLLEGKELSIGENQVGTLSQDGKIQIKEVPFKKLYPLRDELIYLKRDGANFYPMNFKWQLIKNVNSLTLQISTDNEFKNIVQQKQVNQNLGNIQEKLNLPVGKYFWRLRFESEDGKITDGPYWEFKIRANKAPIPITPRPEENLILTGIKPNIALEWNAPGNPEKTDIHIEKMVDGEFTKTFKFSSQSQSLKLDKLKAGKYRWKLKSDFKNAVEPIESEFFNFQVRRITRLAAPEELSPANGTQFAYLKGKPINFAWKPVEGAESYTVTIEEFLEEDSNADSQNGNIIEKITTTNAVAIWDKGRKGNFRWLVQANAEGIKSSKKRFASLQLVNESSLRTLYPKPGEEIKWAFESDPPVIEFKWLPPKAQIDRTVLQFSKTKNFESGTKEIDVTGTDSKKLNFRTEGRSYWRVMTYSKGKPFSASSPMLLTTKRILAAPKLLTPVHGNMITSFEEKELNFQWQPVKGAKRYIVKIFRTPLEKNKSEPNPDLTDQGANTEFTTEEIDETQFKLEQAPFGVYSWSVTALDEEEIPGATAEKRNFSLQQELYLPPPAKIFAPEIK